MDNEIVALTFTLTVNYMVEAEYAKGLIATGTLTPDNEELKDMLHEYLRDEGVLGVQVEDVRAAAPVPNPFLNVSNTED